MRLPCSLICFHQVRKHFCRRRHSSSLITRSGDWNAYDGLGTGQTPTVDGANAGRPEVTIGLIDGPVAKAHPDLSPTDVSRNVRSESRYPSARWSVNGHVALITHETSGFRVVDHNAV
jgi:hypothetical protein